ncbi:SUMF1/EgtB/PvdO family nonheme iron enzyme [Deinococcus malanensis]|uniref:SUMF1/EgtB/PvdO family nonheme iron enzyme n=1 Tax=Deinococcus malanensis TaxID=1706855 RepID=UPI0036377599
MPGEAEWEYAARGGLHGATFAWGDMPQGRVMANTWHGHLPWENLDPHGFPRTSPVGAYPANRYGLSDMTSMGCYTSLISQPKASRLPWAVRTGNTSTCTVRSAPPGPGTFNCCRDARVVWRATASACGTDCQSGRTSLHAFPG